MKEGWEYKSFTSCLEKIPKQAQVKSKDYQRFGKYPIVSQEAELISGYCDDESIVYRHETPIVIFGDHTKNIKYIDFDFVVGADGTHILSTTKDLIPKFFYYVLKSIKLRDLGYARHFKLLKEKKIPVPPLFEQQTIVEYLDSSFAKIDAMKANAEKALNEAKSLFQAALKSLLEPKEGWEEKTLLDVVDENSSISYGIVQPGDDVPNGIPVVRPVDLTCKIITLTNQIKRTAKENSDAYKRTILNGKEILLCVRGTTGIISLTDESLKGCNVTRGLVPLRVNDDTLRNFLYYALLAPVASAFIQHNTRGAALKQINIADVKLIPISLPSSVEQQRIVATLDTIQSKVSHLQSNFDKISKECDALKQALLKQVFE